MTTDDPQTLLATNEFLSAVNALPMAVWSRLSMEALAAAKTARTLHAGAGGQTRVALSRERECGLATSGRQT